MDKWTKLYKQVEAEYHACKKFREQSEEMGRKELSDYWKCRCDDYKCFLILMDFIESEEEEGE